MSDSLDVFSMQIEMPKDQEEKFMKAIKSKTLIREIDKIHGIEPALCPWSDAKLGNIHKSAGSTDFDVLYVLQRRLDNLEACSKSRSREVSAIGDLSINIMEELSKKLDNLTKKINLKVYEKCGSKFDNAEYRIMKVLRDELSFLATPQPFDHPEGVDKIESGAAIFLNSLHTVNVKRREQELKTPIFRTVTENVAPVTAYAESPKSPVALERPESKASALNEEETKVPSAIANNKEIRESPIKYASSIVLDIPIQEAVLEEALKIVPEAALQDVHHQAFSEEEVQKVVIEEVYDLAMDSNSIVGVDPSMTKEMVEKQSEDSNLAMADPWLA